MERNWCGNNKWPLIVNNQILDLCSSPGEESDYENFYYHHRHPYHSYHRDMGKPEESERSSNNSESSGSESGSESEEEDSQTNESEEEEESPESNKKEEQESEEASEDEEEDEDSVMQREIEYFDLHVVQKDAYSQAFIHIKQITDPESPNKNNDVFFPLNQAEDVAESVKELCQVTVPEDQDGKSFAFLQNGVTTTHVELWLEYSPEHKAYSIFFRCLINNAVVSFPKDVNGDKCYNRLEWFRKMYPNSSNSAYMEQF